VGACSAAGLLAKRSDTKVLLNFGCLLGKFEGVRGPGFTLIFVPIQQMARVSLRTVTMQIPSQKIITNDRLMRLADDTLPWPWNCTFGSSEGICAFAQTLDR
jgi:hypothetical protein